MRNNLLPYALLAIVGAISTASATPITVSNPSFEALVLSCTPGPNCFTLGDIPGWIPSNVPSTATFKPSTGAEGGGEFVGIPDGVNVAAIGNAIGGTNIFQALTATVSANTLYTLKVSVGARADFPFSEYTIDLEAGGTVLASDSSLNPSPGTFVPDTITFSSGPAPATLSEQLGIRLTASGRSVTGAGAQADFDQVLLDAAPSVSVPEPNTLFLFVTCCFAFLGYEWIRRKAPLRKAG
jgi:hypothetical protein